MKKRMYSFFNRVWKAKKCPFLCRWNKVESIVPVSEASALIPHHSSGFESASLSSTPDNLSKTSSSLSEDNEDEREGGCSMWANRPSLHTFNITKQDMWGQDSISSIPEYMYSLPGEVPVSVPSVILSAQSATDASPIENSTTGETEIQFNSNLVTFHSILIQF